MKRFHIGCFVLIIGYLLHCSTTVVSGQELNQTHGQPSYIRLQAATFEPLIEGTPLLSPIEAAVQAASADDGMSDKNMAANPYYIVQFTGPVKQQ